MNRLLLILSLLFNVSSGEAANTVQSVFNDAMKHNKQVGTAEYDLLDTKARYRLAESQRLVQLKFTASSGFNSTTTNDINTRIESHIDTQQTEAELSVTQPLLDWELKHKVDATKTDVQVGGLLFDLEKKNLAKETSIAFLELQYKNELFLVSRKKYKHLVAELSRIRKLVAQGVAANIDEVEVKLELERARLEVYNGHKELGVAKAQLFKLTGKMYTPPTGIKRFRSISKASFKIGDRKALVESALKNNLELQVVGLEQKASSQRHQSAKAALYPKLSLYGSASKAYSREDIEADIDDTTIGLQVTHNFALFGDPRTYVAKSLRYQSLVKRQRENEIRSELQSEIFRLHSEYTGGVNSFFTLRNLLYRSNGKISLVRKAQLLGKRLQRDVYNAIIENFTIQESLVSQFYSLLVNEIKIQFQTGMLGEQSLSHIDDTLNAAI